MVCMENGLPCEEVSVLDDTLIPKPSCEWNIGTEIKSKQEEISFFQLWCYFEMNIIENNTKYNGYTLLI